jgi:hypothetical protein
LFIIFNYFLCFQLEIAKQICSLTFDKEKAERELFLFKVDIFYKKLPKSLDILQSSLPRSILTISDPVIRQRLSSQYQRIIQRTKFDLTNVLTSAVEAKKTDNEKKFVRETDKIWQNQHQLPIHDRLTPIMLTLIEQRQKNIIECLKCIYELKSELFLKAAPTTTTII